MTTPTRAALAIAASMLLGIGLAGCTTPTPMPVPTATRTIVPTPTGDGVLRIGTLFPTTGATAFLGKAQDAGVELAVREINEAGGVNGQKVEVFHRDSGDASTTKAEQSLKTLMEKKVDVIIGPSSSVLAERILPTVVDNRIAMISPSATGINLTAVADNGYLFRTIPSAGEQGAALAKAAGAGKKVALVYYSDDTGKAILDSLTSGLAKDKGTLVASESFTETSNNAEKIVAALNKAEPDVVILASPFSATAKNKAIILALVKAKLAGSKLWLTSQNLADYSQALPAGTLKDVNGILQGFTPDAAFIKRIKTADPSVTDFRYAAEAYDATVLAALAAASAGDDSGEAIARTLRSVSEKGIKCTSFGECVEVLATQPDIDYDGISGPLTLDEAGDPHGSEFGLYRYAATNKYAQVGTVSSR